MNLQNCHPDFQATIARTAEVAAMTPEAVYSLWREYSKHCEIADQSALVREFVDWHRAKLGGDIQELMEAAQ